MKKYILFILLWLILSCKNNNAVLQEEPINLYPNEEIIKKQYNKYSLLDPFNPNLILYTPIEASLNDPQKAKTLIKATDPYDLQYLNKYIRDKMNGEYIDYVFQNDSILYRYYVKYYHNNEQRAFDSRESIEAYFNKKGLKYNFIKKKEDKLYTYLLEKKDQQIQSYCVIKHQNSSLEIYLTYDVKDTIKSLSLDALRPFLGSKIEY